MSRVRIPSLTPLESAGQKVRLRSWPELSDPPMSDFGSELGAGRVCARSTPGRRRQPSAGLITAQRSSRYRAGIFEGNGKVTRYPAVRGGRVRLRRECWLRRAEAIPIKVIAQGQAGFRNPD